MSPAPSRGIRTRHAEAKLHRLPLHLAKGGPEQQAIEAGEIDAIIDHASSNVILLPAARRALRALRAAADREPEASRETATKTTVVNSLLAALPHAEYQRLLAVLEPVTLEFGEVLHEPGAPIRYVYFPVDCVISLLAKVEGHRAPEVGVVGHDGMVGISLALGIEVSSVRALVRSPGTAIRVEAARFHELFRQWPLLQREVYRYIYAKLVHARQLVVCNRFHAVEARLARWLLMTKDRVPSEVLFVTQAFLASMLGVRRATVNEAAGSLQQRNLISYSHGKVRILDRKGLEAASCRCYSRFKGLLLRFAWQS